MKKHKLLLAAFGFIVSLGVALGVTSGNAFADTKTWDGGGGDNNFNTAANWNGDSVPSNGDVLVFPQSAPDDSRNITNNMSNLSVAGMQFTTTSGTAYTMTGNTLTVTGNITVDGFSPTLDLNVTLGANIAIKGGAFTFVASDESSVLNLNGYNLSVTDGSVFVNITGAGDVSVTNGARLIMETASGWNGDLLASGRSSDNSLASKAFFAGNTSMGLSTNTLTAQSGGGLQFCPSVTNAVPNPITLSGSEGLMFGSCGGPGANNLTLILAGAITLAGNTTVSTDGGDNNTVRITGTLSGAHTISVEPGKAITLDVQSSNNTSNTPNGTESAPKEVIVVEAGDNQPNLYVNIGYNQEYVINGVRGNVSIASGGILKGTGTVGSVLVQAGGIIAPGQSPGTLTTGDLSFNNDGIYEFEVKSAEAGQFDQIVVNGTVNFSNASIGNGVLTVNLLEGYALTAGQSMTIINNDGSDPVIGTFKDLPEGATFEVDGVVFQISYVGGDGNDVVLTVVGAPDAPDTGFALLANNPIAVLTVSTASAGAILFIARRYGMLSGKA